MSKAVFIVKKGMVKERCDKVLVFIKKDQVDLQAAGLAAKTIPDREKVEKEDK